MKAATFNVNSIRARLPILIPWLEKTQPDVLALQETKVQDAEFPLADFTKIGYHCAFAGQKAYNGVAFISKIPAENIRKGFPGEGSPDYSRMIRAKFGRMEIINTYAPQGKEIGSDAYSYKLNWFQRMLELFRSEYSPGDLVLWAGDLNVAPEDADVHSPEELRGHVCFNKELSSVFAGVKSWGFHDLFRKFHPEPGHYTFFDYRLPASVHRNLGWRIDHLLATEPLVRFSRNCWIDLEPRKSKENKPSDHTVLLSEFDL